MYVDLEMMELFEELESMIKNASSIPFSHKSGIDKEEVLGIIGEIKAMIPEEVKQASWINTERNKIISEAKQEADQIREQAKRDAEIIASENNNKMEEIKKNSEEYDKLRQCIKKQRHYLANKGPFSQGHGFSSGHVWM